MTQRLARYFLVLLSLPVVVTVGARLFAPAPAQVVATPAPPPCVFRVTDTGARPGQDSTLAFERALDAAAKAAKFNPGSKARVIVPSASLPYLTMRPLRVEDGVDLEGEGWTSQITAYGWPGILLGCARTDGDRPDLLGILDESAARQKGSRRGVRTGNGCFLQLQYHDLVVGRWLKFRDFESAHDYWEQTEALTVDLCVSPAATVGWTEGQPIAGVGQGGNSKPIPSPWFLSKGPAKFGDYEDTMVFAFADERFEVENDWGGHALMFELKGAQPPYRISCQVNLKTATAAVWVNGTQVRWLYAPANTGPGRDFEPGHRFKHNEDWPLCVGADGFAPASIDYPVTPLVLAGLHVSAKGRYAVGKPGDAQKRADGGVLTDSFRYFERSEADATVGYLPLDDAPTANTWTVRAHDARGQHANALFMRTKQGGGRPSAIKNLHVRSVGPAIALGAVLDLTLDNVRAESNESVGVGSWCIVASYPITLRNCWVTGGDAAYYGFRQIIWATDTTIGQSGRDAIRLRGCYSVWRGGLMKFVAPFAETLVNLLPEIYAGQHRFQDFVVDTEGPGFGTAVVEAWAAPGFGARVVVDGVEIGSTKRPDRPAVPLVKLHDHPLGGEFQAPSWVELRNVAVGPDFDSVILSDGPNWRGNVSVPQVRSDAPILKYPGGLKPAVESIRVEDGPNKVGEVVP